MVSIRPAERGIQYTQPVVTFDRRGDPIFVEDFEGSISSLELTGADGTEQSAEFCMQGSKSLKIVTAATAADNAGVARYQAFQSLSKHGFEISFVWDNGFASAIHYVELVHDSNVYYIRIRILTVAGAGNDKLQIWNSGSAWTDIATDLSLYESNYLFNTLKFVVDLRTGQYIRAIVNDTEYDLGLIFPQISLGGGGAPIIYWEFMVINSTAVSRTSYFDNMILTQKEP